MNATLPFSCRTFIAIAVLGSLGDACLAQTELHRKPGMWETTMNLAGKDVKTQMCVDAATDAKISVLGQQTTSEKCGHPTTVQKIDGGYSFSNTCGDHTTSGTAIGDFNSAYKVTIDAGKTHMVMDSRWLGPCPPGRKPGDTVLPGGRVVNMNDVK